MAMRLYESHCYSRRIFLSTALLFSGAWSVLGDYGNNGASYKVSWICIPKKCNGEKKTVDDFWLDHFDNTAYELNAIFRERGWLLKDISELGSDKKTAVLTKEYKNKFFALLYNKLWEFMCRGDFKESTNLVHKSTNNHLF